MNSKRIAIAAAAAAAVAAAVVVPTASAHQSTLGNNGCGAPVNAPSLANPPVPILGLVGYALDTTGAVYCFDTARVHRAKKIAALVHPAPTERFLAMDFRPADGLLYFVGSDSKLFTYDVNTGVLSGGVPLLPTLTPGDVAAGVGMDFNPAVATSSTPGNADLRVVTGAGNNYAVNVVTVNNTHPLTVAMPLSYGSGTALGVTGAAYINNDRFASTGTRLFDIDTTTNALAEQGGAEFAFNNGVLNNVVGLGGDSTPNSEIDVYTSIRDGVVTNTGFLAVDFGGSAGSRLLRAELGSAGNAPVTVTEFGSFPDGLKIVGIAIALEQN